MRITIDHTEELYWEVASACETLEGLAETPTKDRKRIAVVALGFIELVGHMKGHEVNADTGWTECVNPVCVCSFSYKRVGLRGRAGPDNLTERLRELADTLEDSGFDLGPGAMTSPLAGTQQRCWYEQDRPGIVETLRKHEAAIAFLTAESA